MSGNKVSRYTSSIVLCGALFLGACEEKQDQVREDIVRPAKVMTLAGASTTGSKTYHGQVHANREAVLSFRVPGRLEEFSIVEGQVMKQGDLIARLDPIDYQLAVDEATAKRNERKVNLDRTKFLVEKGHVSKSKEDEDQAAFDISMANLGRTERDLGYTTMRAAFDGTISRRYTENHQDVTKGQQIVLLQNFDKIDIKFNVPEADVANRQNADVIAAFAMFDFLPDEEFKVELKEFGNQADPTTKTYEVVVTLPAPENVRILPGMTAAVRADFKAAVTEGLLFKVPNSATFSVTGDDFFLWVVDPETKVISKRGVTLAGMETDVVTVTSGLEGGETIVLSGVNFLREGQKIRPLNDLSEL